MHGSDRHPLGAARSGCWPDVGVLCVWLPQLPLRVEVLRHPAWDGRPLVLAAAPGQRRVVQLCSPEAARAGVYPGLPLREVVPLCRDAIIVPPDPVRTAAALAMVLAKLQQVSPAVELADGERFYLDLRGLARLYRDDFAVLERALRVRVPPLLHPRLGAAAGKFTAAVAARRAEPHGTLVVPRPETASFLAPLPIRYLPFAPDALERLDRLGLRRIGDLAALPLGAVQAQFGPTGAHAWRLARGADDAPVVPRGYQPTVQVALRFDAPLASADAVVVAVGQALVQAFGDPALRGRAVRQARVRALLADGTSWERLFTFKEPLSDPAPAYRALKGKLALPNGLPPAPVDELSLELLGLGGLAARQPSLFTARARQWDALAEAGRQLHARYGQALLYQAREVEPWSRIPERRWALAPSAL
jgi:DNA polymerase-4/protein ImuB